MGKTFIVAGVLGAVIVVFVVAIYLYNNSLSAGSPGAIVEAVPEAVDVKDIPGSPTGTESISTVEIQQTTAVYDIGSIWLGDTEIKSVRIGDPIGNWAVVSVEPVSETSNVPQNQDYKILFVGEVGLTGEIFRSDQYGLCFVTDDFSKNKLPARMYYPDANPWFCFRNWKDHLTVDDVGYKDIVIDRYELFSYPAGGSNRANLIKVAN